MQSTTTTITSKLPKVGVTIFSIMSALANKHQAVNLSQGFPDFECHPELIRLTHQYMQQGFNQYAPSSGILPLREKIADKIQKTYGCTVNPVDEITVTSGATEALFAAISAIVSQDDEVIIFEPAYDSYVPAIELNGGKVVPIALEADTYQIDWQKVREAINPKTKLIIINTPHNPSGAVLKAADMQELTAIVEQQDIFLISDEVYEHIIFDDIAHESVLKHPVLKEKAFAISSFGKTFHNTGWKMGYAVAPSALTVEFRKVHQYLTFSTFTPAQFALADFLEQAQHYLELPQFYQERRDRFREMMQATDFRLLPCEGTYFQLASYAHLSQENDVTYAQRITREVGVATIPTSVFYTDQVDRKVVRFCFAKKYETMEQAVDQLIKNARLLKNPA
ncbi:methionine aminotransferase [marine bacterium AO1-C]|nr:methionine aminotransferase [marine bacterium AO1-C]